MCTSCLLHLYKYLLIHTFYNNTVAKNITNQMLEHINSTSYTHLKNSWGTAVNYHPVKLKINTLHTSTTTTIFNKIVTRTKNILSKNLPQLYTIRN